MSDRKIQYSHYKRLLFGQKSLIWNDLELGAIKKQESNDEIEFANNFSFNELDNDDESSVKQAWFEVNNDPISRGVIDHQVDQFIETFLEQEIGLPIRILKSKSMDDRANETLSIIKEDKNCLIFRPIFIANDCVARPLFYNTKENSVAIFSISPKPKVDKYFELLWITKIVEELKIKLKEVKVLVQNKNSQSSIPGMQLDFFEYITINKTFSYNKETRQRISEYRKFDRRRFAYERTVYQELSKNKNDFSVNQVIFRPYSIRQSNKKSNGEFIKKFHHLYAEFWDDVAKIKKAKNIAQHEIHDEFDWREFLLAPLANFSIYRHYLSHHLKYHFPIPHPIFSEIKKEALTIAKNPLINNKRKNKSIVKLAEWSMNNFFGDNSNSINKLGVHDLIDKLVEGKIVWYDFESFSLPFCPYIGYQPFIQIVFQCSIITTDNDKECYKKNIVFDPKNFNLIAGYKEIINSLYNLKGKYYVVYNKSFELTRLQEMVDYIYSFDSPSEARKLQLQVDMIKERTIDLMELFAFRTTRKLPPIFIKEMHGSYSIKAVEKAISNHHEWKNSPMIRHIKEYKNLDVKNGGEAMQVGIKRYLNVIKDREWAKKEEQLKEYCENDVRAMIMVMDFAKVLIED